MTGITNDNTPLMPTGWVEQLQRYHTTSLTVTTNSPPDYNMIVGDFREMVIGARTGGVRVEVLNEGTVTDDIWVIFFLIDVGEGFIPEGPADDGHAPFQGDGQLWWRW